MVRNLVVLPDGKEIFSGSEGSAILSLELTESVNAETELTPGAVCAAMAQITLLNMADAQINAGDALKLYRVDQAGNRSPAGIFLAEKPQRNADIVTVTAYDRLILLDRDLTQWLQSLNGWPYALREFGQLVCAQCGLTLAEGDLLNGDFLVQAFTYDGVTGRQLLGWVAQAAGCFCRMNDAGQPELGWYTPATVDAGPVEQAQAVEFTEEGVALTLPENALETEGEVTLESPYITCVQEGESLTLTVEEGLCQQYYFQGGLGAEDFVTAPIEKVQLRQTEQDVGTVFPDREGGNTLAITGNPLLAAENATTLLPVAETLFSRFQGTCYTPCTLELPDTPGLGAGQVLTVSDKAGKTHTVYIMELTRSQTGLRISCTGSARRDSSFAVNSLEKRTRGKLLQLRCDVDGLAAENSDNAGRIGKLELTVEGIRGQVSQLDPDGVKQRLSTLEQSADGLKLTVETIQNDGASKIKTGMGYTFDDSGLQIARQGQQMMNLLDNTGMYVTRNGQTVLQANDRGVVAADVSVRNYLIVGSHARFEDYATGRTACFYLGG